MTNKNCLIKIQSINNLNNYMDIDITRWVILLKIVNNTEAVFFYQRHL